ncbi:hypothetical protein BH11VER1_BH11VER1_03910 [soil metagenome]
MGDRATSGKFPSLRYTKLVIELGDLIDQADSVEQEMV